MSNQQKTSGIAVTAQTAADLRFRLDLANAVATGVDDNVVAGRPGTSHW